MSPCPVGRRAPVPSCRARLHGAIDCSSARGSLTEVHTVVSREIVQLGRANPSARPGAAQLTVAATSRVFPDKPRPTSHRWHRNRNDTFCQGPTNFARIAYRTNSAVDEMPSLRIADARWVSTVFTLRFKIVPTDLLVCPSAIN